LGMEVDGDKGVAAAPLPRWQQLVLALAGICGRGACGKKTLEIGSAIPVLQIRRELSCVLQEAFTIVKNMEYGKDARLDATLQDELPWLALVTPLAVASLRWPVSSSVLATDATPTAHGGTHAVVAPSVARSLYRLAEHRGEYVRLDWDGDQSRAVASRSRMRRPSAQVDALVRDLPWRVVTSRGSPEFSMSMSRKWAPLPMRLRSWPVPRDPAVFDRFALRTPRLP
jgi:hypothetical protein